MTRTVAVDFDGVIHAYSKGWQDGTIYDDPVPGAEEAVKGLLAGYAVMVFTTRTDLRAVGDYVRDRLHVPVLVARDDVPREFWDMRDMVYITNRKLPAVAYIDDRGIRFGNWPQALADLERYEPAAPETGLDRVAAAVRKARGGDPPVQVRGFA